MKREAMGHRKLKKLCFRLRIPTYAAVGILESIWHLASREAPAGDIGKITDDDIAFTIDYPDDPAELIEALRFAGWIDPHPRHRLILHDWPDHCEDSIHAKLARAGLRFADGRVPNFKKLSKHEREEAERIYGQTAYSGDQRQETAADGGQNDVTAAVGDQRQPTDADGTLPFPAPPCPAPPRLAPPEERASESCSGVVGSTAEKPPARSKDFTPIGEILKPPEPPPVNGQLRHTRAAIQQYFSGADDGIVSRVLTEVRKIDPAITDEECAIWCHACYPDGGIKRSRGPGWFASVVPEELAKRPRDAELLRAFVDGKLPASEAAAIVRDGKADWRLTKALRVWMALQAEASV